MNIESHFLGRYINPIININLQC